MNVLVKLCLGMTVIGLLASPPCSGAELSSSQMNALKRITREVTDAEGIFRRDPRSSTFKYKLGSAKRRIGVLPAGHPEVKALLDRIAAMEAPKKPAPPVKKPTPKPATRPVPAKAAAATPKQTPPPAKGQVLAAPSGKAPKGYQEALNFMKVAYGYKKWTWAKVRTAPGYRKEKIKKALVDAAARRAMVPTGEHRAYLDTAYERLEATVWPGLWAVEGKLLEAEAKANEAYQLLYRGKASRLPSLSRSKDREKLRVFGEKVRAILIRYQKVRDLWKEIVEVCPDFNGTDAARRNKRLRDMGPAAEQRQEEAVRAVLDNLDTWHGGTRGWIETCKQNKHTPKGMTADLQAQLIYAEEVGAPDKTVAAIKTLLADVEAYIVATNSDKAAELEREVNERMAPLDTYTGADKEKLRAMVKAAWTSANTRDEILAVRLKMKDWNRTVKWVWEEHDKAFVKRDKSVLVTSVIVKTDSKFATIYPAYVNKDNVSNTMNVGAHTKTGGYVIRKMLLSNFK